MQRKQTKQSRAVCEHKFYDFHQTSPKIVSRAAIVSNLQAIQQDLSPKAFAKRDIFASNFKAESWQELQKLNANDDEKAFNELKELAKALHSIYDELKTPTAFELAGGNKLFWKVDENKIRFKILSKEQLKAFYEQRQEAKFYKEFLEQMRQNERDLSVEFENLELFLANFDTNLSNAKLNSSAFAVLARIYKVKASCASFAR